MQLKLASDGHRNIIKDFFPDVERHAAICQDLHENLKLPCQEQRTSTAIADLLEAFGFEAKRGTGGSLLHEAKKFWFGTVIILCQPNEERLLGAKAMADDGLLSKIPFPSVCLAQHCVPTQSGSIAMKPGRVLGYLDLLDIRVHGHGAHVATSQLGIDPIMLAVSILTRLQIIVGHKMAPKGPIVIGYGKIGYGTFHAGADASIIPEYADF
ncbi:Metal-dependent amidase/aminoacylase/carboxypeptidase [Penicillium digitatum PHI26]|uniref:Metal-dependent amidase/aminoacylase/carboxypeptidase n=2 Tax=Penicillium digitatum TaxID=36651 RepID=K9FY25_PEND2|nr:Metal-dependent amidase/aminoacylase/carboxypeptidase [Penicillium digitatum Pd1]EKV05931.1 Metal-dependent amidase/aminoacylase/carboxypeptidase [Penicillium digitatum PHI26]EKV17831.1 Metal-dependent amidase/aminoacylase/carboxypeptidase [Penicillium digitatum Pd1]